MIFRKRKTKKKNKKLTLLMLYRCDMNDILYICYIWKAVYSCCCAFNLFIHFLSNLAYCFSINVETNPQVLSLFLSILNLLCTLSLSLPFVFVGSFDSLPPFPQRLYFRFLLVDNVVTFFFYTYFIICSY